MINTKQILIGFISTIHLILNFPNLNFPRRKKYFCMRKLLASVIMVSMKRFKGIPRNVELLYATDYLPKRCIWISKIFILSCICPLSKCRLLYIKRFRYLLWRTNIHLLINWLFSGRIQEGIMSPVKLIHSSLSTWDSVPVIIKQRKLSRSKRWERLSTI